MELHKISRCSTDEFILRFTKPDLPPATTETTKMAKSVKMGKGKEFTFKPAGQSTKYPWEEWFNGDLLMIERSEGPENPALKFGGIDTTSDAYVKKDFDVAYEAMPPKIKVAARKRYKVCDISRRGVDGERLVSAFIIRARDMTTEEKQAEDVLRAEEKATANAKAATNGDGNEGGDTEGGDETAE